MGLSATPPTQRESSYREAATNRPVGNDDHRDTSSDVMESPGDAKAIILGDIFPSRYGVAADLLNLNQRRNGSVGRMVILVIYCFTATFPRSVRSETIFVMIGCDTRDWLLFTTKLPKKTVELDALEEVGNTQIGHMLGRNRTQSDAGPEARR